MAEDKKPRGTNIATESRTLSESSNTAACTYEIKRSDMFDGVLVYNTNNVRNSMPSQTNPNRDSGRSGGAKDE